MNESLNEKFRVEIFFDEDEKECKLHFSEAVMIVLKPKNQSDEPAN